MNKLSPIRGLGYDKAPAFARALLFAARQVIAYPLQPRGLAPVQRYYISEDLGLGLSRAPAHADNPPINPPVNTVTAMNNS